MSADKKDRKTSAKSQQLKEYSLFQFFDNARLVSQQCQCVEAQECREKTMTPSIKRPAQLQ